MRTLGLALLTAIFASASVAQTPSAPPQTQTRPDEPQRPIVVDATLVNTVFTVADKKGKFITNLKKEDFRIFEDDRPQEATAFSSEPNLPLSIALLIDTSGSIRDKLRYEQEAAIEFFYSTVQRRKDKALIISFDSGVDLVQDFTDDPEVLADGVRKIRAGGGTSLYDAIYLAINDKLAKEPEDRRKVLVLISDGDDNSSRVSLTEALELAQRHNITIYAISTNATAYFATKEQEKGDKTLKRFSEDTGGKPFFLLKLQDVAKSLQDIGEELRSQYTIGYRPGRPDDGTFRRIRIEVAANKNLAARHRRGYYAPRPRTAGD